MLPLAWQPIRGAVLLVMLASLASIACTEGQAHRPHQGLERIFREFTSLPEERALAIAGNPNGLWVAGAAGGEATRRAAEQRALAACASKRAAHRLQVPCVLYASGEEIVWRGR